MLAVFDHAEVAGGPAMTFWFRPERPIRFSAGQYIELYLPHDAPDERGTRRWFTISSSPNNTNISLTVNFPERPSTYKQALRALIPGTTVSLSDPLGDFVLPKDASIPLVFVAAGTGSTPYASMVQWLIEIQETRAIQLLYAASTTDAFLFTDLWSQYVPLRLTRLLSRPHPTWTEQIGRLDAHRIMRHAAQTPDSQIYLAGPQSLIEPLYDELAMQLPRHRLLLDYFPGY